MESSPTNQARSSSDRMPFIPAWLDESGLSMAQFRIVCRIAHRGVCFESIGNMARGCRMERKTALVALKELVVAGILTKDSNTGKPSTYILNPPAKWSNLYQKAPQVAKRTTPYTKRHPTPLYQKAPHEVTPNEGSPIKEERPPESSKLSTAELILRQEELARVENRRREIRSSYDDHQTWDAKDRAEFVRLGKRRKELQATLGFAT